MIASHNESIILNTINIMNNNKINKNSTKILFGQLYGMSDYISTTLGYYNYNM